MAHRAVLERWLESVVATPGMTALRDAASARSTLLDDALRALPYVGATHGPVVDVGSGGGSPGIPIAASLPDRSVTLLEAQHRKCRFLESFAADLPNLAVVCGRAETQPIGEFGVALAKALAAPPVAAELCLPLVAEGGIAILWVGPSADATHVARVAAQLGAEKETSSAGLIVLRRVGPIPDGFPRKPGMAKKRPL